MAMKAQPSAGIFADGKAAMLMHGTWFVRQNPSFAADKKGLSADKMAGFTKYQVASSIPLAAQNEGGLAGLGAGLAAGVGFGQVMTQGLVGSMAPVAAAPVAAAAVVSAPVAAAAESIEDRLGKLKGLMDKGLISAADYDSAKAEMLKKLIG